jgi:cytochrome c biogenesis protein CcdA
VTIEFGTLPLAIAAGVLSVLSPCVWPLVPIVMGSAAGAGRGGPFALALGLSVAFALAGTLLSFALVSLGLDPELFRYIAAVLLIVVALLLLVPGLGLRVTNALSRITAGHAPSDAGEVRGWRGQFAVGLLLGLVWLPCVGPTLGAAIALASLGQALIEAFLVMFAFGIGTAATLLAAGLASASALKRLRPGLLAGAAAGKRWLGWALLALGVAVLSGFDKMLEAWAVGWLPDVATSL